MGVGFGLLASKLADALVRPRRDDLGQTQRTSASKTPLSEGLPVTRQN